MLRKKLDKAWVVEGCREVCRVLLAGEERDVCSRQGSPHLLSPCPAFWQHCTALQNTLHMWPLLVLNTGGFTITKYKTRRPLWRRATDKETSMWSPQVTLHSFEKQKETFGAFEVCKQKQIWNNTELHRILWDSLDSLRFFGILWNYVGFIKGFLKILRHF